MAEEKIVFPGYLSRSAIKLWRGMVIQIPGAGHCCQLDKPAQLAGLINQYATEIFRSVVPDSKYHQFVMFFVLVLRIMLCL